MNKQIQIARQNYDLEKASELQYGELPKLQQQLEIEERNTKESDRSLVHEVVTTMKSQGSFPAGPAFR